MNFSKIISILLASSSMFSLCVCEAEAMKKMQSQDSSRSSTKPKPSPRATLEASITQENTPLPIPQSFFEASQQLNFQGPLKISHVLDNALLLGNYFGNYRQENRDALTKKGVALFIGGKAKEALPLFEEAALLGGHSAMIYIGHYYRNILQDNNEAQKWYYLVSTFEAKKFGPKANKLAAKLFQEILSESDKQYWANLTIRLTSNQPFTEQKTGGLSPEEISSWSSFAEQKNPCLVGHNFMVGSIGLKFEKSIRMKKALQLYWQSQSAASLHNIGMMLINDEIQPHDLHAVGIPPLFQKEVEESLSPNALAAYFLAKSKAKPSSHNLGLLLKNQDVTLADLHKTSCFKYLDIKNAQHFTPFQLAARLFKKSEIQEDFFHLGHLLNIKKITIKDLEDLNILNLLKIKKGKKLTENEILARLYLKAPLRFMLNGLGVMLVDKKTSPLDLHLLGVGSSIGEKDISSYSPDDLAARFYMQAGCDSSFLNLGRLFRDHKIGNREKLEKAGMASFCGLRDIRLLSDEQLAAFLFVQSKNPIGYELLGDMIHNDKITKENLSEWGLLHQLEIENVESLTKHELEFNLYIKAKNFNLMGWMFEHQEISIEYLQKTTALKSLGINISEYRSHHDWLTYFYERCGNPSSLNNLGAYYFSSAQVQEFSEREMYAKSADYFKRSGIPLANYNLAQLYLLDLVDDLEPLTRYTTAVGLFESSILSSHEKLKENYEWLEIARKRLALAMKTSQALNEEKSIELQAETPVASEVEAPSVLAEIPSSQLSNIEPHNGEKEENKATTLEMQKLAAQPAVPQKENSPTLRVKTKTRPQEKGGKYNIKTKELRAQMLEKRESEKSTSSLRSSLQNQEADASDFDVTYSSAKVKKTFLNQMAQDGDSSTRRIQELLKSVFNLNEKGLGKPEPLTGELKGYWSRRVNGKDRLVYRILPGRILEIKAYEGHYYK